MENKFDVSVILPIKSSKTKDFDDYFNKAITSLKNQQTKINELVIVHTTETSLVDFLKSYDFNDINVKLLSWDSTPNYSAQINFGINNASSEWVSLFEFDDEYSSIWFKNVKKYAEIYNDVDAYMPLVVDVDTKGTFAGFTNEAVFAMNFTQEIGYLTNDTLHTYQNFQTAGMVIKKKVFNEYGKFKPSFKLTFIYELLLRLTYNSVKIMTIPKIGYKHVNFREGSIFWNYKNGEEILSDDEVKFWIQTAKKEYFFTEDRSIKYEPQNV
jgi:hypothetical protein